MKILKIDTERRRLGNFGERAAVKFLRRAGYKIKRRGFVANGHEIDIIAEVDDTVAFIEVKTRLIGEAAGKAVREGYAPPMKGGATDAREPRAAASVTPEKQRAIIEASYAYLWRARGKKKRFDVIEVYVTKENNRKKVAEINHLINTFNKNTAYRDAWKTGARR